MSQKPVCVVPDQGKRFEIIGGDVVTIKLTAEDTGGSCTVIETVVPANGGPPRHLHRRETESFYVLEGDFEFQVGADIIHAGPGTTLYSPVGIPHQFRNVGTQSGKLLIVCQPGGFENFIEEFSQISPTEPPDPQAMAAIGERYGIEFLPPMET